MMAEHRLVAARIVGPGRAELSCACGAVMRPPTRDVRWVLRNHEKCMNAVGGRTGRGTTTGRTER
jgi:hypothetical protein